MTDIINILEAVLRALNNLEVRGKTNVTNLAGSIGLTEQALGMLTQKEAERETDNGETDAK